MTERVSPYALSLGLHAGVIGALFFWVFLRPSSPPETVEFSVYEYPRVSPNAAVKPLDLSRPPAPPKPAEDTAPARTVFGLTKNTLVEDGPEAAGEPSVTVKQGNTLSVAPDDKKLTDEDAEALPVPTDDYLITQNPSMLLSFKIPYPQEALRKNIEGPVVMDLLVDTAGAVREAKLLKGPGFGLNEAALDAVLKFKFKPAYVKDKPVAVRIRYTYRFVLE